MADGDNPSTSTTTVEPWTEQQYIEALARLEELQDQITSLRDTIPSLVRPLTRPNTTRLQAFRGVQKAAVASMTDVKDFRANWESEKTQEILKRAKESDEKDGNLSAGKDVPVYGWTEKVAESQAGKQEVVGTIKEEKSA